MEFDVNQKDKTIDNENNADEKPELTFVSITSKEDYYTYIRDVRSFKINKNRRIRTPIFGILYAIIYFRIFLYFASLTDSIIYTVVATPIFLILTECINRWYYKYWVYKEYKTNKRFREEAISEIYKNKYREKSESVEITLKFESSYRFAETKDNFLLYESPNSVRIFIPKRIFKNEEELNIARECFKNIKTK